MNGFLEGILYGLMLCILVGPVFFKILHTSVENGWGAGMFLAAGQWFGDFMYIAAVFFGATFISEALADEHIKQQFIFYLGSIGGSMLFLMGAGMLRAAPPSTAVEAAPVNSNGALAMLFAQGFLINTINPFPLFFWISLMGGTISRGYSSTDTIGIFVGTMLTVILTDALKVYLAKSIRLWLKPQYVIYVRRVAAVALMVFALILIGNALTA